MSRDKIRIDNINILFRIIRDNTISTQNNHARTTLYNGDIELIYYYLKEYKQSLLNQDTAHE